MGSGGRIAKTIGDIGVREFVNGDGDNKGEKRCDIYHVLNFAEL